MEEKQRLDLARDVPVAPVTAAARLRQEVALIPAHPMVGAAP